LTVFVPLALTEHPSPYIARFVGWHRFNMCSVLSVATFTVLMISINSYHICL